MFTGSSITSFKSTKKKSLVLNAIADSIASYLGDVEITENGQITVYSAQSDPHFGRI